MLGEKQWKWFTDILENTSDDLYLIVSGVQIQAHNRLFKMEHWPK